MVDSGHDKKDEKPAGNLTEVLKNLPLSGEVKEDLRGGTPYSIDAEKRMVQALLSLADSEGYSVLGTLRHEAERAHGEDWKAASVERYWPRFPLNRVSSNYYAIKSQEAAHASAKSAADSVSFAKLSGLVSVVATAIALVGVVLQSCAKDPKLDPHQVQTIIAAINSAGSPRPAPAQLKLDVAQLTEIINAFARAGGQERETKAAVSGNDKKGPGSAPAGPAGKRPPSRNETLGTSDRGQ